jgi:nitrate reductase cytochrome c-type subunit
MKDKERKRKMKKIVTMLCAFVLGIVFAQPCGVLMAADFKNSEEDGGEKEHKKAKKHQKEKGEHHKHKKKKKEDFESRN